MTDTPNGSLGEAPDVCYVVRIIDLDGSYIPLGQHHAVRDDAESSAED